MALQTDVEKAIALLHTLEDKDGNLSSIKKLQQPPLAQTVAGCKGLVFQWAVKGGAIVSAESTSGFVILHPGPCQWSAPCFLSSKAVAVGLTAGISEISSMMALLTHKAVDKFKDSSKQVVIGPDFSLAVWPIDVRSGVSDNLLSGVGDAVSFAVGRGVLADWSLKGGQLAADDTKNSLVYGQPLPPTAILSSVTTPPEAFKPLYDALCTYEGR